MRTQLALCKAAGIDVSRLDPMEMYLIGGRIIHDEELRTRALTGSSVDRMAAIQAMSPQERADLRERVCGVLRFPGAKQ
jgi:hypothetical protein